MIDLLRLNNMNDSFDDGDAWKKGHFYSEEDDNGSSIQEALVSNY